MEKYGEVPKRFTRGWWEYMWYYYKWYAAGILAVVLFVGITVGQCVTREKFDATITYAGDMVFSENNIAKIEENLAPAMEDINGDGKANLKFQQINFVNANNSAGYDSAMQTRLDAELQAGDTYVYLVSKDMANTWINRDMGDMEVFSPAEEWLGREVPPELAITRNDKTYAVKVTDSPLLRSSDVIHEDLYLMVRPLYDADNTEKAQARRVAIKAANAIINGIW